MPRRLKQLPISTDLLTSWLVDGTPGFLPVAGHLPPDVRIVEARVHDQQWVILILESDEFPPVPEGGQIPLADPVQMRPAHLYDCPLSLN